MRQIKKDSTDIDVDLYIIDSTDGTPETGVVWNSSGIDLKYRREGAAVVSVTEATLAALTTAHTDGGFLTIGFGSYRFDLPDAAFATGANKVTVFGTVTGMVVLPVEIQLVDFDPEDAVRMGLTALPAANADAAGGLPISDAGGLDFDTKLANTNEITVARMGALTDWINGGRLDLLIDAIKAVTDLIPDAGALTAIATDTARLTTARAAVLTDWINGGRLDLLLDAIPTTAMRGTDGANTTVPDAAGVAPTAIEVRQEMDSNSVELAKISELTTQGDTNETHLTDIKGGTFSGATDSLEAIRDRGDSAWTTGAGGSDRLLMIDTTIATLASQTSFTLTAGSTDDNAYNNCTIVIEDVSSSVQKAVGIVSDYVGSTKTITLKYDPSIFTIATTDKVYILAENALKSTLANRQLNIAADGDLVEVNTLTNHTVQTGDSFSRIGATGSGLTSLAQASVCTEVRLGELSAANIPTDLSNLLAAMTLIANDTDELQGDWTNGGRLDLILDELTVQGDTNETAIIGVQTDLSNATDGLGALKTLIDTVNTDLSNGTDGLGALKTLIDALPSTAAILTTALTESYAADGATATLSELLYMLWSVVNSLKFVTITGTSRKLDGTTTAMTFTIDDADNPTDINRTT